MTSQAGAVLAQGKRTRSGTCIFQTQAPAYCASETPDDPESRSAPQPFFAQGTPLPRLPIDYHCIGDGEHVHLFFTGDDGLFYCSRTTYAEFPKGFNNPVSAMRGSSDTVFEGSITSAASVMVWRVRLMGGRPGGFAAGSRAGRRCG